MSHGHQAGTLKDASVSRFDDVVKSIQNGAMVDSATACLMAHLTDQERIALLDGDVDVFTGVVAMMEHGYNVTPYIQGQVERLGISGIRSADGPQGCVLGKSNAFPVAMARGATWSVDLEERVGRAIGWRLGLRARNTLEESV